MTWTRRYIVFHHKPHPAALGAADISAFLTWLATKQRVSASTQNQALAALLFLYEHVLHLSIGPVEHVVRVKQPVRLPVVLSRDEVGLVLSQLDGAMWILGMRLYGAGLRLEECLELRVKDIDFDRRQLTVRRARVAPRGAGRAESGGSAAGRSGRPLAAEVDAAGCRREPRAPRPTPIGRVSNGAATARRRLDLLRAAGAPAGGGSRQISRPTRTPLTNEFAAIAGRSPGPCQRATIRASMACGR